MDDKNQILKFDRRERIATRDPGGREISVTYSESLERMSWDGALALVTKLFEEDTIQAAAIMEERTYENGVRVLYLRDKNETILLQLKTRPV